MTAALARSLLQRALATLPLVGEDGRARAFAAIDVFTARPAPSTHLGAVRVLRELRGEALRSRGRAELSARARDRGLGRVAAVAATLAPELAALALTPATGRRLSALATLLEAHDELVARVRHAERARQPFIERIWDEAQKERRTKGRTR